MIPNDLYANHPFMTHENSKTITYNLTTSCYFVMGAICHSKTGLQFTINPKKHIAIGSFISVLN